MIPCRVATILSIWIHDHKEPVYGTVFYQEASLICYTVHITSHPNYIFDECNYHLQFWIDELYPILFELSSIRYSMS